jgi:hypothetical protein
VWCAHRLRLRANANFWDSSLQRADQKRAEEEGETVLAEKSHGHRFAIPTWK